MLLTSRRGLFLVLFGLTTILSSVGLGGTQPCVWVRIKFSSYYPHFAGWGPRAQVDLVDSNGIVIGQPHGDLYLSYFHIDGDYKYTDEGVILSPGGGFTPFEPEGRGTIVMGFASFGAFTGVNYAICAAIIKYQDRSWQGWFGGHVTVETGNPNERQEVQLPAGNKYYTVLIDFTSKPPGITKWFGWPSVIEHGSLSVWLTGVLNPYKTLIIHAARLEEILVSEVWIGICERVSWR